MKIRSKTLKFLSRDGLKLSGTMVTPSKGVSASILMVHGITSDRSEWGIFDKLANVLAQEGVASLRFDYRGHGVSKLDSDKVSLSGITSDILAAWDQLEKSLEQGEKSLPRYILGSSFGGGLSYAAASRIGTINRLFLLAPVFDYLADLENCAPRWQYDLKRKDHFKYNDLKLGRALANEALYLEPLSGKPVPTTIFHGTMDTDVPIALSKAVAAEHPDIELIAVKGAGHVLNLPDDIDLDHAGSWKFVDQMIEQVRKRIG